MPEPEPGPVLLFGDINIDNLLFIPEYPVPGRDGLATRAELHLGGAVCNSAVGLTCLQQAAALLGAMGDDPWADIALTELARADIDTSRIVRKAGKKTGLIFIVVTPDGERTMFCHRAANTLIAPVDLPLDVLQGVSLVQISGYAFLEVPQRDTAWRLIELARDAGIPVCLDSGLEPVIQRTDELRRCLSYLTCCVIGDQEACLLTGMADLQSATTAVLAMGPELAAIKLGSQGCLLARHSDRITLPAFPVNVLDTTGAGDAFSAGIIYGWLHDFNLPAMGVLANALGGLAVTVPGGAHTKPAELLAFLHQQFDYPFPGGLAEVIRHFTHGSKDTSDVSLEFLNR